MAIRICEHCGIAQPCDCENSDLEHCDTEEVKEAAQDKEEK